MSRFSRYPAFVLLAITAGASVAAEGIDPAKACAKTGEEGAPEVIDPVALVYMAIASGGQLQAGIFDSDMDGNETAGERLNVIFDAWYCEGVGKARCGKGDQDRLDAAQINLRAFLQNHVNVVVLAEPSAEDVAKRPLLADTDYGEYARALDEGRRFARLECKPRDPGKTPAGKSRWRVSNSVDGLSLARGTGEQLAAVPQAELAFLKDNEADQNTFDVSAVIGYNLSSGGDFTKIVPYVEARHKRVSGDGGSNDDDTKKWGAGIVFGHVFESLDDISLAPHYAVDKITDAEVAVLKAAWTPGFLYHYKKLPFDRSRGNENVSWKIDARLLAEVGRVFEVGTSTLSRDEANFSRIGPWLSATVWLHPGNAFLSKISLDAYYKNLVRLDGPGPLMRFSAGVNYSPEKTDHFSFRLSYDKGREDDTLKRIDGWKLSFGVRY